MKNRLSIIGICLIVIFVSCRNKGEQNDIDNQTWYESVFPTIEEDTNSTIPDYAYSTDWMQLYIQYIQNNFEYGGDDILFSLDTVESFDCRYWSLAYVDSDTIPEMLLYGGCWASGSIILTQHNGKVCESPKGGFMFIEGGKGLLHSQRSHSDEFWGEVYEMNNGQFIEKVNYYCFTNYYDTNDIEKFGLNRDNLSSWQMGDGTVGISGVKINEEVVDVNYGYCNWSSSKLQSIMNSMYYSKGNSIRFPKPKELMSVVELFKK